MVILFGFGILTGRGNSPSAEFWDFLKAMHYNGGHPPITKDRGIEAFVESG